MRRTQRERRAGTRDSRGFAGCIALLKNRIAI